MAIETLTVTLGVDDNGGKVKGKDLISGNENDNQIVTVLDGGDLNGTVFTFEFWGKGTPTEPGAGPGGDDKFLFDLSNFNDNFFITVKSMDPQDCFIFTNYFASFTVGTITTFFYTGSDGLPHFVSIDAESTNGTGVACVPVCFARGTRILTDDGEVAVENLSTGDRVICGDGDARPILWVGSSIVDGPTLSAHRELYPIRFEPDSIEPGQPKQTLRLSPQHRVLLRDWRAELLFGEAEVLAPAHALVNDGTIRRDTSCREVEYFHILLDEHHTIFANGLECETLMPGEMAKTALSPEARSEILMLFPEMVTNLSAYGDLCRMAIKPHQTEVFMAMRDTPPPAAA